jgi:hypothetical protein
MWVGGRKEEVFSLRKRMAVFPSLLTVAILTGVGMGSAPYYVDAQKKESKTIKPEDQIKNHRSEKTNKLLERTWNAAIAAFNIDTNGLDQVDYADNHHIWDKLDTREQVSYTEAVHQAMSHHKIGDYEPLLLVDKDVTQTTILFQRGDDKTSVKIELKSKTGDNGKEWFVDGQPEEK